MSKKNRWQDWFFLKEDELSVFGVEKYVKKIFMRNVLMVWL